MGVQCASGIAVEVKTWRVAASTDGQCAVLRVARRDVWRRRERGADGETRCGPGICYRDGAWVRLRSCHYWHLRAVRWVGWCP